MMISIVKKEIIKQIVKHTLCYKNQVGGRYSARTLKSETLSKLNPIKEYLLIALF